MQITADLLPNTQYLIRDPRDRYMFSLGKTTRTGAFSECARLHLDTLGDLFGPVAAAESREMRQGEARAVVASLEFNEANADGTH